MATQGHQMTLGIPTQLCQENVTIKCSTLYVHIVAAYNYTHSHSVKPSMTKEKQTVVNLIYLFICIFDDYETK